MGFIKSIKRFDTNYDVKLSTYAVPYMIGEIKRYIRDDGPIKVSRSIKELSIKIKELQKEYFYKKGEEITINKIAEELKVSKEDILLAMESHNNVDSLENTAYTNHKDGNKINLIEKLSNNSNQEELITNRLAINQMINNLETKDKEIILLRYYKEKTQAQVAKILGITQVQVSRIERKILNKMKKGLEERGLMCQRGRAILAQKIRKDYEKIFYLFNCIYIYLFYITSIFYKRSYTISFYG